jgi:hypothetical protein
MLIVWVIGAPVLAFVVLYKHRNNLEEGSIKKYLLMIYQGIRPEIFYWEFVNTIRKSLIIAINTTMSLISVNYRVLISIVCLLGFIRLQLRLKPFRNEENNNIEIKAITAGTMALCTED